MGRLSVFMFFGGVLRFEDGKEAKYGSRASLLGLFAATWTGQEAKQSNVHNML